MLGSIALACPGETNDSESGGTARARADRCRSEASAATANAEPPHPSRSPNPVLASSHYTGDRMPSDWPLVGREAQIGRVSKLALELGRGIVFAGPAGAGKSSLGRASLKWAQENHLVTAEVVATRSASAIPFGAWAPLLPNAEEQDSRAIGSLARFLRSAEAAVVQRAGGGRLFLFVDDAHLLDDGSAVLLR